MLTRTPVKFSYPTKLARLGVDFPVMVAPMVGLTHVAFRHLMRLYTPEGLTPLLFTEMLSTRRLPRETIERVDELKTMPDEPAFIPQLLGNEDAAIAASIAKLLPLKPWGFDINMGCPARQTLKHNWGVRLLGDPHYAAAVVAMTKRHSPLPVSVKMRCGQDRADPVFLSEFSRRLADAGADWLSIHARTQSQKHKGDPHWQLIADLKQDLSIPVVVNGDVQTAADVVHNLRDLGLDGVMIGRAATARPWILWQSAYALGYTHAPLAFPHARPPEGPEAEGEAFLQSILHYRRLLNLYFQDEDKKLRRLRFHVINAHKWFLFGHAFFSSCMKAKSLAAVVTMTETYLERRQFPMHSRIEHL